MSDRTKAPRRERQATGVFDTGVGGDLVETMLRVKIKPERLLAEVMELHRDRPVRQLSLTKRVNGKKLEHAAKLEARTRSRLVEIMLQCRRITGEYENLLDAVILRILHDSPDRVPGSTKTDKQAILRHGFRKRLPEISVIYDVIDAVDYIMADVDQSAFTLSKLNQIYELSSRHEVH